MNGNQMLIRCFFKSPRILIVDPRGSPWIRNGQNDHCEGLPGRGATSRSGEHIGRNCDGSTGSTIYVQCVNVYITNLYIYIYIYIYSADDWSTRARRQQCGEASLEVKQRAVLYTHQRWAKALVGPHPPSEHSPQAAAGH